jgi:hypothetical protein
MRVPFAWLFKARGIKPILGLASAYVAIYSVLSLLGHYQDNLSSLKQLGIMIKGIPDRHEWQPMFTIVTHFPGQDSASRANVPGYLFTPLVLLDQNFCHKTQPMGWDGSAVNKYMGINDYVAFCVFAAFGIWWLLFPRQVIGFYVWFHRSRFKPPTLFGVRLAGALWLAVTSLVLLAVFSNR